MPNYLGSIQVHLGVDMAQWVSGLEKATKETQKFGRDMERAFGQLSNSAGFIAGSFGILGGKGIVLAQVFSRTGQAASAVAKEFSKVSPVFGVFAGLAGAASVAAISVVGGLVSMATHAASFIEETVRMSEKTGIAVPNLLALKSAGATVGVSLDAVVTAMRKFSQQISGIHSSTTIATADLKALGITSRDPYEALLQLADAFSKMEDGSRKTALAVQLLGRGGMSLIPILNEGRAGIEKWLDKNKELAEMITGSTGAVKDWKSSVEQMNISWERFQVTIGRLVIPELTKLLTLLAENPQIGVRLSTEKGIEVGLLYPDKEEKKHTLEEGMKAGEAAAARLRKADQDAINDALIGQAALLKAGTRLQFDLAEAEKKYAESLQTNNGQEALAQAKKIEGLKARVALYDEEIKRVEKLGEDTEKYLRAFVNTNLPQLTGTTPKQRAKLESILGATVPSVPLLPKPQPPEHAEPFAGAPGTELFGAPDMRSLNEQVLGKAADALRDFWSQRQNQTRQSVDAINAEYDAEENQFRAFAAADEITQEQLNAVLSALEGERLRALREHFKQERDARRNALLEQMQDVVDYQDEKRFQHGKGELEIGAVALPGADFKDTTGLDPTLLNRIREGLKGIKDELSGEWPTSFADVLADAFRTLEQGISHATDALADFIVTGRGNFLNVLTSMSEELVRAVLRWAEMELILHVIAPLLQKLFGVKLGSGGGGFAQSEAKSAASAAGAYNAMAAAKAAAAAAPNPAAMIAAAAITEAGLIGVEAAGTAAIKAFAEGGPISGGQLAIIGEKGPELFRPRMSGEIISNRVLGSHLASSPGESKTVHHIHNWHVVALDGASFADHLDEHRDVIARMISEGLRERNQL